MNTSDSSLKEFYSLNGLKNLINKSTYYKNSEKPHSIDLILTDQPALFQCSTLLETGLSDFHLLTVWIQNKFPKMQVLYYYLSELQKLWQWQNYNKM